MKTPQEKAKELIEKFSAVGLQRRNEGVICARIAVDEILKVKNNKYWQSVKEILK